METRHSKTTKYPPPEVGDNYKNYVSRVSGTDYYLTKPWVDNMAGWTEAMGSCNPLPREGGNDSFHMDMVKGLCLEDREAWLYYGPNPQWDMD